MKLYKIRRPLETDRMGWFGIKLTPHIWIVAGFGWRMLLARSMPYRFELWRFKCARVWRRLTNLL